MKLIFAVGLAALLTQVSSAQGTQGLYEANLKATSEYTCNIALIQAERTNILAELNGKKLTPADYDPIIAKANECLTIVASHAYFARAKANAGKGNTSEAFADFEKALTASKAESPKHVHPDDILRERANLHIRVGDRAKAEADLREAIAANPNDDRASETLADLDKKMADARKARAMADPQTAEDFLIAGDEHARFGRYDLAVAAYDRSIALSPSASAHYGKGSVLRYQSKFDASVAELNKALALTPNDSKIIEQRGYAYKEGKNWDGAIADFTKVLSMPKADRKSLLYARGFAYAGKGSYDLALKDQTEALALSTDAYDKVNALTGKGDALSGLGRGAEALDAYNAAIAAAGTDAFARLNLMNTYVGRGRLYVSQGKTDLAKADFNESIKISPKFAVEAKAELAKLERPVAPGPTVPTTVEAWGRAGRDAANAQKWDDAIKAFTECVALDAKFAPCYAWRGAVYGAKGDLAASDRDFEKAFALDPKEAAYHFMRGQMNAQAGRKNEAITDFRNGLKLAPGNPRALKALEMLGATP
jgi:tetratricopeptide (TPR) repeat protein